ncbi:MAG: helix-hairpin-helix domain-containing protein [Lacibacter sp.]
MISNSQIADAFLLLSKLMEIHGENPFKAKAYSSAAFALEKLPLPVADIPAEQLTSYKGIGKSAAKKITEMLQTGSMQQLNNLIQATPPGVLEMLHIKGLGPKKIATIWKEMGIESVGELLYACQENRLLLYKGFGEKTQQTVRENIEYYLHNQGLFLYAEAEPFANEMQALLLQQFPNEKFVLTGAFRRQLEIIDRLEWVTTVLPDALEHFLVAGGYEVVEKQPGLLYLKHSGGIMLQFHCCSATQFGSVLFSTSASEDFLKAWGQVPADAADEATLFHAKGIAVIPPFLRETFPVAVHENLIQPNSIRGIIHSHSNWSDGNNSIEEMAQACLERGLEYLVISDHSQSAGYANGLTVERIREQHRQIDALNARLHPFRIFKSIEADILGDGRLDYSDEILAWFDLVIASVHSNLRMTEEKAMQRLLAAIQNPFTTILGHMTGRLLLSRPGYPVNHEQIIEACVAYDVAIELNAHPRRLDIDWRWLPTAIHKGAYISINPDAHDLSGFDDTRYGVLVAQKGNVPAHKNLSSMSLQEFENWLRSVKEKKKRL